MIAKNLHLLFAITFKGEKDLPTNAAALVGRAKTIERAIEKRSNELMCQKDKKISNKVKSNNFAKGKVRRVITLWGAIEKNLTI